MGVTMSDAGVYFLFQSIIIISSPIEASITVTSLTNFGCFGALQLKSAFLSPISPALGYFLSPTPAVGDFCILTAVGVAMDYFYQAIPSPSSPSPFPPPFPPSLSRSPSSLPS